MHQGGGRWEKVESCQFTTRPGATQNIADILEKVAPQIKHLFIGAIEFDSSVDSAAQNPLDTAILRQYTDTWACGIPLIFPHLTSLTLGNQAIMFPETLILLCGLSPNLHDVDCHLDERFYPLIRVGGHHTHHPLNKLSGNTKIEYLCVVWHCAAMHSVTHDFDERCGQAFQIFISLIERSPNLAAISTSFEPKLGSRMIIMA